MLIYSLALQGEDPEQLADSEEDSDEDEEDNKSKSSQKKKTLLGKRKVPPHPPKTVPRKRPEKKAKSTLVTRYTFYFVDLPTLYRRTSGGSGIRARDGICATHKSHSGKLVIISAESRYICGPDTCYYYLALPILFTPFPPCSAPQCHEFLVVPKSGVVSTRTDQKVN